jgi:hypothetical protein
MNNDTIIQLEIGKKYITRNGLVTEPLIKSNNGTRYFFESKLNEPEHSTPSICAWLGNGKFLASGVNHRLDLISEV